MIDWSTWAGLILFAGVIALVVGVLLMVIGGNFSACGHLTCDTPTHP